VEERTENQPTRKKADLNKNLSCWGVAHKTINRLHGKNGREGERGEKNGAIIEGIPNHKSPPSGAQA